PMSRGRGKVCRRHGAVSARGSTRAGLLECFCLLECTQQWARVRSVEWISSRHPDRRLDARRSTVTSWTTRG
ncbi:MAG: hypothetical protein ACK56F_06800, partial [bacterium]